MPSVLYAFSFPAIDPVLLHIGPLKIHWYGLAYMAGILMGWCYAVYLAQRYETGITKHMIENSVSWILVGIVLGGRLGHVILYDPIAYFQTPWEILKVWKGGMSFHGGLAGVIISLALYCRQHKVSFLKLTDILAAATPIGLFLGRLANFVNGELYGRVTDKPWGIIFPTGGPEPRHPSQLYEAFLEGIVLFCLISLCWRYTNLRNAPGRLCGLGLFGYGVTRMLGECFREPEIFGLILNSLTWGQVLSLPLVGVGWFLLRRPVIFPATVKG